MRCKSPQNGALVNSTSRQREEKKKELLGASILRAALGMLLSIGQRFILTTLCILRKTEKAVTPKASFSCAKWEN